MNKNNFICGMFVVLIIVVISSVMSGCKTVKTAGKAASGGDESRLVIHYTFEDDEAVRSSGGSKKGGTGKTKPTLLYFLVKDSSESSNNGKFYNGNINNYVDGKSGKGINFDGIDDYINTQYGEVISEATYSFWFKADPINRDTQRFFIGVVSDYNGNPSKAFFQYGFHYARCGEGKLGFGIRDSDNPSGGTDWGCFDDIYDDGVWHHSALVYGSEYIKLYVDGYLKTSIPITNISDGDKDFTLYPYYIGARNTINSPTGFFNGIIDDVKVWNYALSEGEVREECGVYCTRLASVEVTRVVNCLSSDSTSVQLTISPDNLDGNELLIITEELPIGAVFNSASATIEPDYVLGDNQKILVWVLAKDPPTNYGYKTIGTGIPGEIEYTIETSSVVSNTFKGKLGLRLASFEEIIMGGDSLTSC